MKDLRIIKNKILVFDFSIKIKRDLNSYLIIKKNSFFLL